MPSPRSRTCSLIFPQGGQGKRLWLTVWEPSMKAGWRDALIALRDSVVSNIHFIDKNVDSTKKKNLKRKLEETLKNIEKEFKKLTGKKMLKMQGRKKNYLAYLKVVNLMVQNWSDTLCQNLTTVQNIKQN